VTFGELAAWLVADYTDARKHSPDDAALYRRRAPEFRDDEKEALTAADEQRGAKLERGQP
jgi:hypothetical protein